jgi:hypothetical protein
MLPAEGWVVPCGCLRHQHLDGLSDQFLALVAEQAFGLRIHQDDLALVVTITMALGAASTASRKRPSA